MDQDPRPSAQDPTRPHGPDNHNPRSSEHPDVRRTWAELVPDPPGAVVVPADLLASAPSLVARSERQRLDAVHQAGDDWVAGMLGLRPAGAIVDETSRLASRDHARTRATRGRAS